MHASLIYALRCSILLPVPFDIFFLFNLVFSVSYDTSMKLQLPKASMAYFSLSPQASLLRSTHFCNHTFFTFHYRRWKSKAYVLTFPFQTLEIYITPLHHSEQPLLFVGVPYHMYPHLFGTFCVHEFIRWLSLS